MALYKVYESDVFEYHLQPPGGYTGFSYNDTILAGDYYESMVLGVGTLFAVWGMRKGLNETQVSHTKVYALYMVSTVYHPSWGIVMATFDGQSGQRLWTDWNIYRFNVIGMATRDNFWQDTDDASWSHSAYGYSMRHPVRTEDENQFGGATGMPHFMFYDIKILDSEWLDPAGSAYTGGDTYLIAQLAVLPKENRAICVRGNRRDLLIHNYTTKKELFRIRVSAGINKAIAVDNEILYAIASNGVIHVINYKTGQHGGILSLGLTFSTGRWIGAGYDPVYRRLLAYREQPDEVGTGACKSYLEGYRMAEVPGHLVAPIPLKAPRLNRVVPVYTKVVGGSAKGVPGLPVQSEVVGSNGLNPQYVTSDAKGKAIFYWDTAIAGTDIDQINLSVEYETELPGLSAPPANTIKGVPPCSHLAGGCINLCLI
jgi:hypothetical protein